MARPPGFWLGMQVRDACRVCRQNIKSSCFQEISPFPNLKAEQSPSILDPREGAEHLGRRREMKQQKLQPKALISWKARARMTPGTITWASSTADFKCEGCTTASF